MSSPEMVEQSANEGFTQSGGWPAVLSTLARGEDLSRSAAEATMAEVLAGRATDAQLGALLLGLRVKGDSVDEIVGFVEAMSAAAVPLAAPADTIDIVGTGGSAHRRSHALNVSTMACFVAAACGATVCKHGNLRASSTSGSFDFLAALGIPNEVSPAQVERSVAETGLGFAFARTFHPAMRHAGPVRSELGIPTVFNTLGPLANPARVSRQVIGAATEERASSIASALAKRGSHPSWVVTGHGGLDELSISGPSIVFQVRAAGVDRVVVEPASVGIEMQPLERVAGGDAEANVTLFRSMLDGAPSPHADIVILNAAAGLVVAGVAANLQEGVADARQALSGGLVKQKLDDVVAGHNSSE